MHASIKSFNNHWGVPLSLSNMPRDTRFSVFEIGMNHAGEIDLLTRLVRPHIAIVTTIAPVHLGFFRSIEEIADAKAEVFRGLEPGGIAIINRDNPHYERLKNHAEHHGAKVVSFGEAKEADVRVIARELSADRSTVNRRYSRRDDQLPPQHPRAPYREQCGRRVGSREAGGRGSTAAARALAELRPQPGRGARTVIPLDQGAVAIIDESDNANPASMRMALAVVAMIPRSEFKRRVAVLGDMLELGPEGRKLHEELARTIDATGVDVVFACGELMGSLYQVLPAGRRGAYAKTAAELAPALIAGVGPGDAIMVKGSLGSRMGPLVEALKRRFDSEVGPL